MVAGPAEDAISFSSGKLQIRKDWSGRRLKPNRSLPYSQGSGTERGGHPVLWSIGIVLSVRRRAGTDYLVYGRFEAVIPKSNELVCTQTGCELSPWREPERFVISSRVVRTHPE